MADLSTLLATKVAEMLTGIVVPYGGTEEETLTGYVWSPLDVASLPAAVVHLPRIERTSVDDQESQIGTRDFVFSFPVDLLFELRDVTRTQQLAASTAHAVIDAVDQSSPPLGDNTVIDAKVVDVGRPEQVRTPGGRDLLRYPALLEVLKLAI